MAPPKHSSPNRITVPTPNAQIAQQRRNNVDINKSYDRLHKQFKKLSVKSSKQADELQALRAKTPKTEHHANALQRQIERLTSEKNQAEKKCKIANEARRKIEQKLAGGSGGQYLAEKYQALRTRTRALKTRCEEQAQVLESQENSLNKAAGQIDILARALEVRVYELGLSSSSSNPNKRSKGGKQGQKNGTTSTASARNSLLYEVAQQRHEMQQMASELATNYDTIEYLKKAVIDSETKAITITEQKTTSEDNNNTMLLELNDTTHMLKEKERELAEFTRDRDVMIDYIKDMQEKNVFTMDENECKIQLLRKELTETTRRMEEMVQLNKTLTEEVRTVLKRKNQLEKVQQLTEGRLASEHVEIANMRAELSTSQQNNAHLVTEVTALNNRIANQVQQNNSLAGQINMTNELRTATSDELGVLRNRATTLETSNKTILHEKMTMENKYQININNVMTELEDTISEKETITKDMNNAVQTLKLLRAENTDLAARLGEKRGEADAMRENKGLLQKTLLDQITTLRDRVHYLEGQLSQRGGGGSGGGGRDGRNGNGSPSSPNRSPKRSSPSMESRLRDSAMKRQVSTMNVQIVLLTVFGWSLVLFSCCLVFLELTTSLFIAP